MSSESPQYELVVIELEAHGQQVLVRRWESGQIDVEERTHYKQRWLPVSAEFGNGSWRVETSEHIPS